MRRLGILMLVLTAFTACAGSSSSTGVDTGDGGGGGGGGGGGSTINNCTTFVDQTSSSDARKITWDLSVATAANRCMMIKKGQTVAFEGNFTMHPLVAAGGDSPNPFASVPDTGKVTFATTGTYGFVCNLHSSMTGAIKVVE